LRQRLRRTSSGSHVCCDGCWRVTFIRRRGYRRLDGVIFVVIMMFLSDSNSLVVVVIFLII
jgi:hypothetical protein